MAFAPDKITKQHVLDAVKKIDSETIPLEPSKKFDVIVNGKAYPPKEVMRYAHELMNGEHIWERSGGKPTNKYFTALGFQIKSKSNSILKEQPISGNIWKLGCNWDKGNPSFYELIKENEIVVGVEDKKYAVGDLILVTEGFNAMSIAKILESPQLVTKTKQFEEPFESLNIPFEDWINISNVEWYELDEDERFTYQLQAGIRKVQDSEVKQRVIDLWNSRNSNYWIFRGNPNAFDFETAIRNNLLEDWRVSANEDKIKIGDKVILWISGKNSGCYSLAEITSEPHNILNSKDSHLWKTEDKNPIIAGIKITHNIIDNPLLWIKIKGTKGLENLKVGNQGTNFSATKKEYKTIYDLIKDSRESENTEDMQPKNIILYGPPGTGKTYNSIDKAVKIASSDRFNLKNHKANKNIFDELRKAGQIEFVTFHQNYSYEDFMVGIKPNVTEGLETLTFKKHYGIFYEITQRAKENYLASLLETGKLKSVQELINELLDKLRSGEKIELQTSTKIKFTISYISESTLQLIYSNGSTNNTLSVDTLQEITESKREFTTSLKSYYYPLKDYLLSKQVDVKTEKMAQKNFVLVIDEINRANISKVFGELITLLEDDKRLGEENELKVSLPNGEKEFGVPPNLFIIGTMNTADKSIALVDIALRRRFEFIGKYPDYDEIKNVDAKTLLQKINEKIYKLKNSADYLIGHAYFIKGQPIEETLRNKIVPLLMEYCSGKTEIVTGMFDGTDWNVNYNFNKYSWDISKK